MGEEKQHRYIVGQHEEGYSGMYHASVICIHVTIGNPYRQSLLNGMDVQEKIAMI